MDVSNVSLICLIVFFSLILKISKSQRRLIGIEFLCQHTHDFLPEVYGVYKEEDTICIFLEYIQGITRLYNKIEKYVNVFSFISQLLEKNVKPLI